MSLFERVTGLTEGRPGYEKVKGGEVYPPQPYRNNPWSFRINAMQGSIVSFEEKNGKWVVLTFHQYKPDVWAKKGAKLKASYPTKEALIADVIKVSKKVDALKKKDRDASWEKRKIELERERQAARAR